MPRRHHPPPRPLAAPTLADVAREAGVNASTVSRVLSRRASVREETRQRVLAAADRLNYRPSRSARSLASRRSMTVGVMLADLRNLMHADFLDGAQEVLNPHGYSLFICDGQVDPTAQATELERLFEMRVDALLVTRSFAQPGLLDDFVRAGVPVEPVEVMEPKAIARRNRHGSYQAFRHLLDLGHRRFAMFIRARVDAPRLSPEMRSRVNALVSCLRERGLDPKTAVDLVQISDPAAFAGEIGRLLHQPDPPTAFIAGNDWVSAPMLGGMGTHRLDIPGDVSVVCYGDSRWAEAYRPPLDVIRYDYRHEGASLARRVLRRLGIEADGTEDEETGLAPEEFVPRASSGRPKQGAGATRRGESG